MNWRSAYIGLKVLARDGYSKSTTNLKNKMFI